MGKLDGAVAIVTGAGRGLGRAYAHRLASLGATIAVVDIDLRSYTDFESESAAMTSADTASEITDGGGTAQGFALDVSDRAAVLEMVDHVHELWGRVDILVTNAGGGSKTPDTTIASELALEDLDTALQRNLYGTVNSCVAVSPLMKEQGSGRIVTVSSHQGSVARPGGGYSHYATAKAGIVMYTRHLAQALGPFGINVNCIAPGFIATGRIVDTLGKYRESDSADFTALRRLGQPTDCAKVVEFLCTDLSDYVTGTVIPVDGGWNRGPA